MIGVALLSTAVESPRRIRNQRTAGTASRAHPGFDFMQALSTFHAGEILPEKSKVRRACRTMALGL
jgi:hypothetical protein